MIITKTKQNIINRENKRIKANIGCNVCPGCGNTNIVNVWEQLSTGNKDCIVKMTFRCVKEGLFTYKSGSVDRYECKKCGTEWESEIY